jgi:hypothetical protein
MDKLSRYPKAEKDLVLKVAQRLDLSDDALDEIESLEMKADSVLSAEDVVNQATGGGMNGQARPFNRFR